jgi:hypothetical protein
MSDVNDSMIKTNRTLPDGERIRRALATRDEAELSWARDLATSRLEAAAEEGLRGYWREIVRRIDEAMTAEA